MVEDVGDAGSMRDAAEISLRCTWQPLAMAGRDSVSPHLADKLVPQESRSLPSCSHNSSIVTGLLPTRSSDTTIETCATPVDLTLRMMMDIHW